MRKIVSGLFVTAFAFSLVAGTTAGESQNRLKSRFFIDKKESLETFKLIERDIAYSQKKCAISRADKAISFLVDSNEVVNAESLIKTTDRDPLDVLLRRTRILYEDLKGGVNLDEEGELLNKYAAEIKLIKVDECDRRYEMFEKLMKLRRKIAFKNPLLKDIKKILFVGREALPDDEFSQGVHMCDQFFGFHATKKYNSQGDGLYVLENPFSENPTVRNLLANKKIKSSSEYWNGKELKGEHGHAGGFLSPDVSWDGNEIVFSWTKGVPTIRDWNEESCFHIMKCKADGSDLEMITSGKWNDLFPCWMPNGRIIFCSERRGGYGRCHFRACPNFTLHTMFPDGTDIVCISPHETNEFEPAIDNNGMVVYTRWDYVDRGFNQAHHPWITYPDGRDPREIHGNTRTNETRGAHFINSIRPIPNSRKYVATACGHHTLIRGSLVIIDPSIPDDDAMSQIKRITPDQLFPESEWHDWDVRHPGSYATAWPLSEKYFLCVYDGFANGQYGKDQIHRKNYALVLVDVFGNKVQIYKDENELISCFDPMPLAPRKKPITIPHKTTYGRPLDADGNKPAVIPESQQAKTAEIGVIDVYNSRYPMPKGVKIKALRIWQILPKTEPLVGCPRLGVCDQTPGRQCLGTVPVEEDGSARFEMPVKKPFYMQALDENGCAVQTMRSATYTQPGERLTCNGCHERRNQLSSTAAPGTPLAYRRPPSKIKSEVEGAKPWNYPILVQGVFDKKCISCHSPESPRYDAKKMPNLTKGDIEKNPFNMHTSFIELTERRLYQYYTKSYKGKNWWKVPIQKDGFVEASSKPGKVGARASKLYHKIRDGHNGIELTDDEMHRLILFMDAQGAYISHDYKAKEQCEGKVVEPSLE